jgi:hypothetical protein
MKRFVMMIWVMIVALNMNAQQYRVQYEPTSLPELYTTVQFFAVQGTGGAFNKMPARRYKLSTKDGKAEKNNMFTFEREHIYANKGVVNFTLSVNGRDMEYPVALPVLKDIRFNLYTDSIKPILNYYVNVEGEFTSGKIFPLTPDFVTITADKGEMRGMEWVVPKQLNFDHVTFTAQTRFAPLIEKKVTLFIKQYKDPRDAPGYQDRTEEEIIKGNRRR